MLTQTEAIHLLSFLEEVADRLDLDDMFLADTNANRKMVMEANEFSGIPEGVCLVEPLVKEEENEPQRISVLNTTVLEYLIDKFKKQNELKFV